VVAHIDSHRDRFGIAPTHEVLQVAPCAYSWTKTLPAVPAVRRHIERTAEIARVTDIRPI